MRASMTPGCWQELLAHEDEPRVDWTATAAEALQALRAGWASRYPVVADPLLDSVAADLGDASGDIWAGRLGQTCTVLGLWLCLLERGDDQYRLLLIRPDDLDAIAALATDHGLTMSCLVEPGFRFGQPIPTVPVGPALEADTLDIAVAVDALTATTTLVSGRHAADATWRWLDLAVWPPQIGPPGPICENAQWSASGEVCVADVTLAETIHSGLRYAFQSTRLDFQWRLLPVPRSNKGRPERICAHGFVDEDLFLLGVRRTWRITGFGSPSPLRCEDVTPNTRDLGGNAVIQLDSGGGLIALGGRFHTWHQGGLEPMPIEVPSEGLELIPWVPLGDDQYGWVQPWRKRIVCTDVSTGDTRSVAVPELLDGAALHPCPSGWLGLTDAGRVTGATGVLRFWNPQRNLWRRMPRGSLGGAGAEWIKVTPTGELLVGSHDCIRNLGGFASLIERMEPITPD